MLSFVPYARSYSSRLLLHRKLWQSIFPSTQFNGSTNWFGRLTAQSLANIQLCWENEVRQPCRSKRWSRGNKYFCKGLQPEICSRVSCMCVRLRGCPESQSAVKAVLLPPSWWHLIGNLRRHDIDHWQWNVGMSSGVTKLRCGGHQSK